jgi:hypothetical protein
MKSLLTCCIRTPDSCQVIIPIMDDLWTLYDQKIYFQDPAAILLCHIVSNHKRYRKVHLSQNKTAKFY